MDSGRRNGSQDVVLPPLITQPTLLAEAASPLPAPPLPGRWARFAVTAANVFVLPPDPPPPRV